MMGAAVYLESFIFYRISIVREYNDVRDKALHHLQLYKSQRFGAGLEFMS